MDIERDRVAAEFVMSVNGGNETVPTMKFDDPTASRSVRSRPFSYITSARVSRWLRDSPTTANAASYIST